MKTLPTFLTALLTNVNMAAADSNIFQSAICLHAIYMMQY
jgi:hypothetical protein